MTAALERGSVVSVRFDPSEGREIRKTRPAVVVSNDAACRFDAVIQVVPVTGLPDRPLRPYESRVDPGASGLDAGEQEALDRALRIQLGLGSG